MIPEKVFAKTSTTHKYVTQKCYWLSYGYQHCFFLYLSSPQETAIWLCGPLGALANWPAWRGEALRPLGGKLVQELWSFRSWRTRAAAHIKSLRPSPVKVLKKPLKTNISEILLLLTEMRDLIWKPLLTATIINILVNSDIMLGMVVQWLTLSHHSKKVPGVTARSGPFCVTFACSPHACMGSVLQLPPTV